FRRRGTSIRIRTSDHANRAGILAMIGAMGCFVVNDALVKYASQTMPAAQLIFVRGVMASVLVLAVAQAMGATRRIREIARGWVAVRAVVDAIATMLFLVSLFHLPLANATAINMASPLIITVLAAVFLGERLGLSRWVAVGIGFLGVVLIIQPQAEGFNDYALVCLLSTVLLSVRDIVTRRVHAGIPSILVTLSNTVAVTLLAGGLSLVEGWRAFTAFEIGLLAVVAVFLSTAYYLIVISTRRGDLSLVAPFRYTAILFATVAGFVIWGDTPNALAWCGIALVIASGIYVLRVSRRARAAPVTPD
ncbi:MAG: DMT family transporter, partial [Casimicrobiaceae bacterium]